MPNPSVEEAVAFAAPVAVPLPIPVAVPVLVPMTTTPPLLGYESTSPFTVTLPPGLSVWPAMIYAEPDVSVGVYGVPFNVQTDCVIGRVV